MIWMSAPTNLAKLSMEYCPRSVRPTDLKRPPTTHLPILACSIAPAHIGQGSIVVYSVVPDRSSVPSVLQASAMASVSAWISGLLAVRILVATAADDPVALHDHGAHAHVAFLVGLDPDLQADAHEMFVSVRSHALVSGSMNAIVYVARRFVTLDPAQPFAAHIGGGPC